jgi:hypothetical protein
VSKVAGFIIGALEIGIGIATSNPMLIAQGTMTIAMQAIVDLTAAKQPAREASEMAIKLSEQPRSMFVGEGYTPGSLVDGFNYGGHDLTDWECLLIRLTDHPCEGLTGFFVNDEYIPYTGNGNYPHFDGHHFELYFRADTTAEPLPDVVLDHGPGWTAADQGKSGCDVLVCYFRDPPNAKKPAWPGGRPRFGFVLKGKRCYDPRKDDTVPGGVGPHRWDDPTTWEWSENAIVCWYNFERGVFANDDTSDPTKLLVGRGLTAEESPPEMIFAAANLCDEIAAAAHPAVQLPINGLYGAYFSPDRTLMVLAQNPGFEIWYLPTRSRVYGPTLRQVSSGPIAVNPDGSFYCGESGPAEAFTDGVSLVDPSGAISVLSAQKMEGGVWKVAAGIFGRWSLIDNNMLELTAGLVVPTAVGFQPSWYFDDQAGVSWAIGGVGTGVTSYTTGIGLKHVPDGATHIVATTTSGEAYAFDNNAGQFVVWQGGKLYLIDKATFAIVAGPVAAPYSPDGGGNSDAPFRSVNNGDAWIWIGFTRFSATDLSILETINPNDWTGGASHSTNGVIYDRFNDALLGALLTEGYVTLRELHRHGGYRVAGPIYASQPYIEVERMFAAATAGSIVTRDGTVQIEPGQAKSVVATFTDADLVVGTKVSWNQGFLSESSDEWLNTVVPTYVEPAQKWNSHSAPPARVAADIIADGKPRESQLPLRLVRYLQQAQRIAEIARRLGRLWGRGQVTLGPRFCELEDGDWVAWQSDRYFGGATRILRIDGYQLDEKWQNTLTLRDISGTVYADDATFTPDLSRPTTTPPPPPTSTPSSGTWTLTPTTLDSAGASVPVLELTGDAAADDTGAESVIVEYWKSDGVTDPTADPDSIPWTMVGTYASSTAKIDITGLTGGATYYVALTYVVSGMPGDRLVLGPETVAELDVSPQVDDAIEAATSATLQASEAIAAGSFVNVYSSSGAKVRKANATDDTKPVNGFAPAAIANAASGSIRGSGGKIGGLTGLTPGATYYLDTTPGAITDTPPSASGNFVQELGVAVSATELLFNPKMGVTL